MQLVVYGRDDLDTLGHMTTESFSAIPNRNVTKATYNTTSFPPEYSGYIIHYYPEADSDILTILWQITPSLQPRYRNAVGSFLTRYLSHQGTTSAAYELKIMNYATSLSAGVEVETDSYTLFMAQIELTENGIRNVSEVVRVLFRHIVRFQSISAGEFNQLWADFQPVSQIRFDYSERATPIDYVR
jgi:insulysin